VKYTIPLLAVIILSLRRAKPSRRAEQRGLGRSAWHMSRGGSRAFVMCDSSCGGCDDIYV